jgi:ribonuclease J
MNSNDDDLAFLPLGGTGEIGMNLNLYRCNGQWLAVDCGARR